MPDLAILSPFSWVSGRPHGGITPVIRNLTLEFASNGIEVDLLVRQASPDQEAPNDLPEGVRIVNLNARGRVKLALAVANYLKATRPRVLLSAGHRFNISAAWAGKLAGTSKVFHRVGNPMSREAKELGYFHWWKRMRSISFFYNWADGIIAISDGVAQDLMDNTSLDQGIIHVIHNPILTKDLLKRSKEPVQHPWFHPGSPPVIIGVGRLARQKGFDVLLRAFVRIRNHLDCRLMILGEGPEKKALENLATSLGISEYVNMPGFIPNPFPFIRGAAVFALPSIYEGFGNVLVEALAVETPVVAADCPGAPREILDGGRYGRLVPTNDHESLADAILETLNERPNPSMFAKAVRPFKASTIAQNYMETLGLTGKGKTEVAP